MRCMLKPLAHRGTASASSAGDGRFDPRPRHTKDLKMVSGAPVFDAQHKRVTLASLSRGDQFHQE